MILSRFLRAALAALCAVACAAPSVPSDDCRVARVSDGDTFYCRDGRKVRLIGVDAPVRLSTSSCGVAERRGRLRVGGGRGRAFGGGPEIPERRRQAVERAAWNRAM